MPRQSLQVLADAIRRMKQDERQREFTALQLENAKRQGRLDELKLTEAETQAERRKSVLEEIKTQTAPKQSGGPLRDLGPEGDYKPVLSQPPSEFERLNIAKDAAFRGGDFALSEQFEQQITRAGENARKDFKDRLLTKNVEGAVDFYNSNPYLSRGGKLNKVVTDPKTFDVEFRDEQGNLLQRKKDGELSLVAKGATTLKGAVVQEYLSGKITFSDATAKQKEIDRKEGKTIERIREEAEAKAKGKLAGGGKKGTTTFDAKILEVDESIQNATEEDRPVLIKRRDDLIALKQASRGKGLSGSITLPDGTQISIGEGEFDKLTPPVKHRFKKKHSLLLLDWMKCLYLKII